MRKFSAHYIFPVDAPPLKHGILITEDDGTVIDLIDTGGKVIEEHSLEFYPGILIPGLVNAHCHLELSWLHQQIPEQTGLAAFIGEVNSRRDDDFELQLRMAQKADGQMLQEGIVAVGDISNTGMTASIKASSQISYHTFVEVFGLNPDMARERISAANKTIGTFKAAGQPATITPHAPYSISSSLWKELKTVMSETKLLSIHHQESPEENLLYESGQGPLANSFISQGFDIKQIDEDAGDIHQLLNRYAPGKQSLLVHNTMVEGSRLKAQGSRHQVPGTRSQVPDPIFVLCPSANLYIENRLPDINGFAQSGLPVCLGTDSLASNSRLSILHEMKVIQSRFGNISFEQLLQWASLNGAKALKRDDQLGSFKIGKRPGVLSIQGFNFPEMKLNMNSQVKRLI